MSTSNDNVFTYYQGRSLNNLINDAANMYKKNRQLEAEIERLNKAVERACLLLLIPANTRKSFGHLEEIANFLKEYGKDER